LKDRNRKTRFQEEVLFFSNPVGKESSLKLSPTYLQCKLTFNLDDCGKKASRERACNKKGRAEMTLPSKVVLVGQRLKFWGTVYPPS